MYKIKKYALLSLIVALFGEIYFYPLEDSIKFSAGIVVLNIIILTVDDISSWILTLICGAEVLLIRSILTIIFFHTSVIAGVSVNFPSFIYYMFFGAMISVINIKNSKENIFKTVSYVALIDSISNVFEAIIRNNISSNILRLIIIIGFARSFTAYLIYLLYNKQQLFILNREHQERYTQLNIFLSNIQAELFYLKKSMGDIEKVMRKSYTMHEKYSKNKELNDMTLDIAREIHEIKKDYYRVLKGFEVFIENTKDDESMTISNIFDIINDNTQRYLKKSNKNISITFSYNNDFYIKSYYNLFTILNNLIINSIDACRDGDYIKITQDVDEEYIYVYIKDTGEGIGEDIIPYIFNPGFTTKYDELTGKASTGIGLSHVKNIIDDLNGEIKLESHVNSGTLFKMKIPKNMLIGGWLWTILLW